MGSIITLLLIHQTLKKSRGVIEDEGVLLLVCWHRYADIVLLNFHQKGGSKVVHISLGWTAMIYPVAPR